MPAYALNYDDPRISRDTLLHLPSAYNYWFPAFSGITITQLTLSPPLTTPTGLTSLATCPRCRHVRHAPDRPQ